ncbi:hypothetical protein WH47_00947 [Habropoda laboriosa]|uniref:Uncharacterized protein n=1 Tax=Habropoda laboriosa TaxID=597456 RepID=A0A0L7R729_9HYME|nr:hypothetical protein WH47_00947 [Habropoda laboriosa]
MISGNGKQHRNYCDSRKPDTECKQSILKCRHYTLGLDLNTPRQELVIVKEKLADNKMRIVRYRYTGYVFNFQVTWRYRGISNRDGYSVFIMDINSLIDNNTVNCKNRMLFEVIILPFGYFA